MCPNTASDGPPNVPTTTRLHYALAECGNRIFMYGGVNEKNEILSCCDWFDCCTYKFSPLKYRGDYTPQGRQGAAAVALDKYTLVIIGGTFSTSSKNPKPLTSADTVISLNTDTSMWH